MVFRLLFSLIPTYGNIARMAAFVVGMLYPTFESFRAIESRGGGDDTQWLTYWVCYSTLLSVEWVAWGFLMWLPFYRLLRVGAMAWLALPQFQGATFLYETVVRPFLLVAVDKARELPALEPYTRGFGPAAKKDFESLKREAVQKVEETFEKAKAAAGAPEEEEERSYYQPLKQHAT